VVRRAFLHVGLPKSGTTYLQAVIGRNKARLAERAGLLYPGESWGAQVDAVRDLRHLKVSVEQRPAVRGAWDRLVAEIRQWPGDSLVSMEWLCMASPDQIARIASDLAGTEVHVVFTVRDIARTVPAAWQEFMQNRAVWQWPEFLEQISCPDARDSAAGATFWKQQDVEMLLGNWSPICSPEQVHVISLPQSGGEPGELWRRMATVLAIDPDGYELDDLGVNASLGRESAELMRRVNEQVVERRVSLTTYNRVFKRGLAKTVLAGRREQEGKVVLPPAYHDWARDLAEQQIGAIKASGVNVVGSLDELRPQLDASAQTTDEPSVEGILEAGVLGLAALAISQAELVEARAAALHRVEAELERSNRANAELRADIERRSSRPVRQALIDTSARHPVLHRARVGYWKAVDAGRRLRRST